MSFIATANAVVMAGGIPVFAEIEPETFNLDFNDVRRRITSRTRAIVLVHQLGIPADINTFQRLAREHGLTLVEDAACAIGSTYGGEPIGSHSEYVCFSFHPRKLITTGDGGMILTPSAEHAALLRRLRQHGMSVSDLDRHESARAQQEHYLEVGFNYRLTDIQAAVGIEQLRRLSDGIARRGELRAAYDRAFADCPGIAIPFVPSGSEWNVQTYAVRLRDKDAAGRDAVRDELLRDGIATRVGVMTAHREPAYSRDGTTEALPLSEKASDSSLALPLYGEMSETDCRFIAERAIRAVEGV